MREATGEMFRLANEDGADAVVITTNGAIRKDGACVMGRGCALIAKQTWPWLPFKLGERINHYGNHVYAFDVGHGGPFILTLPVKHSWEQQADPMLIKRSVTELEVVCTALDLDNVYMPRPGCGNGRLRWDGIRPILNRILDDRFTVVTFGEPE